MPDKIEEKPAEPVKLSTCARFRAALGDKLETAAALVDEYWTTVVEPQLDAVAEDLAEGEPVPRELPFPLSLAEYLDSHLGARIVREELCGRIEVGRTAEGEPSGERRLVLWGWYR